MEAGERLFIRLISFAARVVVWGLLIGVIYVLRAFFLLMFLTFIFAYMQAHAVRRLKGRIKSRPIRVTIVGLVFVGIISAFVSFLVPTIKAQAYSMANNMPLYMQTLDEHIISLSERSALVKLLINKRDFPVPSTEPDAKWQPLTSPTVHIVKSLLGEGGVEGDGEAAPSLKVMTGKVTNIGAMLIGAVSSFLLAILFSFLIVLDLPRLRKSVKDLSNTKLRFIYNEIADSVGGFGRELGKVFEAQAIIATLNTCLTAIGLYFLGITGKIAFLSMGVFFCSFIPIAGVFISSIPICIVGLQIGGIQLLLLCILLITVIHMVEAYILNPQIYGQHMSMNPVLVLAVLTVSGKLFGVWGFLLGLPVCTYIFKYAIRYKNEQQSEE